MKNQKKERIVTKIFLTGMITLILSTVNIFADGKTESIAGEANYAYILMNGEGVDKNVTEAINIYKKIAKKGHVESNYAWGGSYIYLD